MPSARTLSNKPHRQEDVKAIVLKLPYHLDKLAGLIQSSYIPTGYFSLLFRFQGIHSRGVNSLQGLVDSRHLSSPLASVIPVTTNACSLTSVSVTVIFYGMGSLAPSPTLLFYPGLVPAEHTHTGMDYPHRDKYTQVAIIEGQEFRKTRKH